MRRFIDREAEIIYVPPSDVFAVAEARGALAFDIPGAPITHDGDLCRFDALLARFGLKDPALATMALIVRCADTDRHGLAPETAGLHAISLGLSRNYSNVLAMLEQGMIIYEALYAWALGREASAMTGSQGRNDRADPSRVPCPAGMSPRRSMVRGQRIEFHSCRAQTGAARSFARRDT